MIESASRSGAPAHRALGLGLELDAWEALRAAIAVAGLLAALLFVVVGSTWKLQLYGDGAIFSYAVAVQDSWNIHWHNIVGRVTVYLAACLPAELLVGWTGSARAGIALYGLLFFSAQLAGLAATFAADRSRSRVIFAAACLSTACLCPLVFGFPTEMWYAHALFWPFLALVHYPPGGPAGALLRLLASAALVHTHGGGAVFAGVVVLTTALRRPDGTLRRALAALVPALLLWAVLQVTVGPDDRIAPILLRAAFEFIDPRNLLQPVVGLLLLALIGPFVGYFRARSTRPGRGPVIASAIVALILAAWWWRLDRTVLVAERYPLRTALFYGTPLFGVAAVLLALQGEAVLRAELAWIAPSGRLRDHRNLALSALGALALVACVHTVETAKFLRGWAAYTDRVRVLAAAPPPPAETVLSSSVVPAGLLKFAWSSTTPYLAVVATPDLAPARLVVSAHEGYRWIPCALARSHADRVAVPQRTRELVRRHACTGE